MNSKLIKDIAGIINHNLRGRIESLREYMDEKRLKTATDLADLFEREDKEAQEFNKQISFERQFNRQQFLKDAGVK